MSAYYKQPNYPPDYSNQSYYPQSNLYQSNYPAYPQQNYPRILGFDFASGYLWQGLLIGAGLTLVLSNENVQKFILKAVAQSWTGVVSGIEEIKEKFEDVKQEINLKKEEKA